MTGAIERLSRDSLANMAGQSSTITEGIANADAHLNNVGLPTYTELANLLRDVDRLVSVAQAHMSAPTLHRFNQDYQNRLLGTVAGTLGNTSAALSKLASVLN